MNLNINELMGAIAQPRCENETFTIHTRLNSFTFDSSTTLLVDQDFDFTIIDFNTVVGRLNGDLIIGWSCTSTDVNKYANRLELHHKLLRRQEILGWVFVCMWSVMGLTALMLF